ncbi:TPA: hypothetical protein ACH3X1_013082 [Trebouxia sp. C0004]
MQHPQIPRRYDAAQADQLSQAIEIMPGRLYMAALRTSDGLRRSTIAPGSITYCIDSELVYEPFYADFGPLNLGLTYRFCQKTQNHLQMGIFQVVYLGASAEEAYQRVQSLQPFTPFRDASCGPPSFNLTVLHCIQGLAKAKQTGFIDWHLPNSTFSLEEYEHYEQVENGDLNWILPGKLLAFSGPSNVARVYYGFKSFTPDDYVEYFRQRGVSAVVRLNKPMYDAKRFTDAGFRHYELYFPDGSCPPDTITARFLEIAEREGGALAIHCKAGLGRTGVLICSYLIKHHDFTPEEAIGYIRVCRPGSVIGLQQNHLLAKHAQLQQAGQLFRQQHQMGCAPEVATHLERMQPASAPPARPHRPAAMAGALLKPSERPATARLEVTASSRTSMYPTSAGGNQPPSLQRASSLSSRSPASTAVSASLYTPPSANTRSSSLRASTSRLTNFLSSTPSSLRASFGRSSLLSQSSPDPLAAVRASGAAMGRANSQPPSPQMADMSRAHAPGADPSAAVGKSGVTRTLAPNGQPRKVPTALLAPGNTPVKPARLNSGGGSMESSWKIGVNSGVNQAPPATTYGSAFGRLSSGTRQTRN